MRKGIPDQKKVRTIAELYLNKIIKLHIAA